MYQDKEGNNTIARFIVDIQYNDDEESDMFFNPSMFQRDLEDFLSDNEYSWDKKIKIRVQDEYCIKQELKRGNK